MAVSDTLKPWGNPVLTRIPVEGKGIFFAKKDPLQPGALVYNAHGNRHGQGLYFGAENYRAQ